MPCIQPLLAPDEPRGAPAYGDPSHLPVSDSSSSSIRSPLEAFGDVPSRQAPCCVEALSACIDNPARARIIAVMALDIFARGTPLNGRFDRWICPFSNCKRGFSDPRDMILHTAQCVHVSPNGAYCNCCCEYYNFPGNSRAYRISAGESVSPAAKTSTMAKGKRKISDLISRCSGSASSSHSQLSAVSRRSGSYTSSGSDAMSESPTASRKGSTVSSAAETSMSVRPLAELDDYHVVELDNSVALQNRPTHELDATVRSQQRSTQTSFSTLSAISTTGYMDSMNTDYGDLCMSPTDYTASDLQHTGGTQTREGGIPYATGEVAQHHIQTAPTTSQDACWNLDQRHDVPWRFHESAQSSQSTQGQVVVPNFSFPLHGSAAGNGGDGGFNFHDSYHQTAVNSSIGPQSHSSSQGSFDFLHHQFLGHGALEVGIAVISTEPVGIAESTVETRPPLPRLPTGSSGFSGGIRNDDDVRCQELGCTYRPNGAEAHRQANLNKHMKHMHGDRATLPCERCGSLFTRRDNLLAHQRDVCGRRRAQRHSAYRNRRSAERRPTRRILTNV